MLYQLYGLVIDIDDVLSGVPSIADVQVDIQVRCNTSSKRFSKTLSLVHALAFSQRGTSGSLSLK